MYELRSPAPALAEFIEHYWLVTPDQGPVDIRIDVFVDARADLIFNFGVPYTRLVIGGSSRECSESNVDAQRLKPIRIVQKGLVRTSGVRFRLGGLSAFTSVVLSQLTDCTVPPSDVLGSRAQGLASSLESRLDIDDHAKLYDAFFLDRLRVDDTAVAFRRALGRLVESGGRERIDELAAGAGVSARHLDRLFQRYLGIAPKTVGRIQRFQVALGALMRDPGCPLSDVAAAAGYFDQSHFIREFKRMSGGVPRGYRGYYPPEGPDDFAPNVVAFVQDDELR